VIEAATGEPLGDGSAEAIAAMEIARAVRTGTIGVNDYQMDIGRRSVASRPAVPAVSSVGRLAAYQTLKSICKVGPAN
jgi:aldehyde dehydrogenase (NAD+)